MGLMLWAQKLRLIVMKVSSIIVNKFFDNVKKMGLGMADRYVQVNTNFYTINKCLKAPLFIKKKREHKGLDDFSLNTWYMNETPILAILTLFLFFVILLPKG